MSRKDNQGAAISNHLPGNVTTGEWGEASIDALRPDHRNRRCARRLANVCTPGNRKHADPSMGLVERAGSSFSGRDYRHDPRAGNVDRQPVPRENRACSRWMFVQNCAFRAQGSAHQCTVCRRGFRSPHLRAR
jgi:hypothetical protein